MVVDESDCMGLTQKAHSVLHIPKCREFGQLSLAYIATMPHLSCDYKYGQYIHTR